METKRALLLMAIALVAIAIVAQISSDATHYRWRSRRYASYYYPRYARRRYVRYGYTRYTRYPYSMYTRIRYQRIPKINTIKTTTNIPPKTAPTTQRITWTNTNGMTDWKSTLPPTEGTTTQRTTWINVDVTTRSTTTTSTTSPFEKCAVGTATTKWCFFPTKYTMRYWLRGNLRGNWMRSRRCSNMFFQSTRSTRKKYMYPC